MANGNSTDLFLKKVRNRLDGSSFTEYQKVISNTFSGCDIQVMLGIPNFYNETYEGTYIELGSLQTLSYSSHREVYPVRAMGADYGQNPVNFTRGPRTNAGTMIWTMLDMTVFHLLFEAHSKRMGSIDPYIESTLVNKFLSNISPYQGDLTPYVRQQDIKSNYNTEVKMDQLLPFDLYITFQNEYGSKMAMDFLGVRIIDEGLVLSINDIITEQTMSLVCRELKLPYPIKSYKTTYRPSGVVSDIMDIGYSINNTRLAMKMRRKYANRRR